MATKSKNLVFLIFFIVFYFGVISRASADVLSGASCTVSAKVLEKNSEVRKAYGPDGVSFREYESKYLKLEILTTKKAGVFGNCDFIKVGNVFKIDGGSDPEPLKIGDIIQAGVELNSVMGPSGVVGFIEWTPISLVSDNRPLPATFDLQSGDKLEKSITQPDKNTQLQKIEPTKEVAVGKDNKNGAEKIVPVTNDGMFNSLGSIIIFGIVLILVGGLVYYFISRQRKIGNC
jgi:hypothetical protein